MITSALSENLSGLLVILTIFTVGVASPGPATLMILGTAMARGRAPAVALSLGVVLGSMAWATVAALGFVAALKTSATLFTLLKVAGGLYLLFLAIKAWRSALTPGVEARLRTSRSNRPLSCFVQGLLLHLTNPKAPLVWMATLSVGGLNTAPLPFLATAILLCALIGITVFVGYALLFSTRRASRMYLAARRPIDAVIGTLFGAAAIRLFSYRLT